MSQRQDIYNYLLTGASIEPLTALNLFGCLSLSQRLGELRREFNIPIQSRMVEAINGKRHACYWLDKSYITKVKTGELQAYQPSTQRPQSNERTDKPRHHKNQSTDQPKP